MQTERPYTDSQGTAHTDPLAALLDNPDPEGGSLDMGEGNRYYRSDITPITERAEGEVLRLVDEWFDRAVKGRLHVERQALLNMAFYMGVHDVDIVTGAAGAALRKAKRPSGAVIRTQENETAATVRREVARITRNRPHGVVVPDGPDMEDAEAADAGDAVLHYVLQGCDVESYFEEATWWATLAGTALVGMNWDPDKVGDDGFKGNFEFRCLSPYDFAVPKVRESRLQEQPYVVVSKAYTPDEVYETWGVKVSGDSGTKYQMLDDRLTAILQGTWNPSTNSLSGNTQIKVPKIVVKEVWVKPAPIAPNGAVVITAGGKILHLDEWPSYLVDRYPFAVVRHSFVPGSFWAKSLVTDLIPIQRRLNRALSAIVEKVRLERSQSVVVPKNANMRSAFQGQWNVVEMPRPDMQASAHVLPPPPPSPNVQLDIDQARLAFRGLSSQHEVTIGQNPPGSRAGLMIEALKESDDSVIGAITRDIEKAQAHLGNLILRCVRQEWVENEEGQRRMVRVVGSDMELESIAYLSGEDVGGTFVVEGGSAWPYFHYERMAQVKEMMQLGMLDPQIALRFMNMGAVVAAKDLQQIDVRQARRENILMRSGEPDKAEPAEDFHNHAVHLLEHNNERKRSSYQRWPDEAKMLMELHIAMHDQLQQQEMMQQAEQAQMMQMAMAPPEMAQMPETAEGEPVGSEQPPPGGPPS